MYKLKKNYYSKIYSFYFDKTLNSIIDIGNLDEGEKKILDFGCGFGKLKSKIKNNIVFNYDIDPEFSDYKDWKDLKFDVFVANQVLYLFSKEELNNLITDLKKINPKTKLIIGISYQNFLSKVLKNILGHSDAHRLTRLNYYEQINILQNQCSLIKEKDNLFLNKVHLFEFL